MASRSLEPQEAAPVIRPVGAGDYEILAALLGDSFEFYGQPPRDRKALAEILRAYGMEEKPLFEAILAERDGEPVGFAMYGPVFWTGDMAPALFLKEIFVVRRHRQAGTGRALMAALARITEDRGWSRIIWHVDRPNARAIAFYDHLPGAFRLNKHSYAIGGKGLAALAAEAEAI